MIDPTPTDLPATGAGFVTIGSIGLSNVSASQLCRALPAGIAAVSNSYNLLHRKDEPLLRLAEHEGMVWSPFFPLGGAILKRFTSVARNPTVQQAARRLDATPSQVGLAWLLAHSSQSVAIAGTTSRAHLDENVAAAGLRLPDDVLQTLDAARG